MIARKVIFEGRVQGVGFRYSTKNIAKKYEISGWVKNLVNGNVELVASGNPQEISAFISEIVNASPHSNNIHKHTISNFEIEKPILGFTILK